MRQHDPRSAVRPAEERRRAVRVRPGPLRVRFHRACEGVLVDISETGALVQLPSAPSPSREVTMQLEWQEVTVSLSARVVRTSPHKLEMPTGTLARPAYHVALQFLDLTSAAGATIKHILRSH